MTGGDAHDCTRIYFNSQKEHRCFQYAGKQRWLSTKGELNGTLFISSSLHVQCNEQQTTEEKLRKTWGGAVVMSF